MAVCFLSSKHGFDKIAQMGSDEMPYASVIMADIFVMIIGFAIVSYSLTF